MSVYLKAEVDPIYGWCFHSL